MMSMRRARFVLRVLLLGSAACGASSEAGGVERAPSELRIGSAVLRVEVSETPEARARGLMGRDSLPRDHGMVFLFDGPTTVGFWMKDTLIPLSIAFWDDRRRIVSILDMQPCKADPCPTYGPDGPYVGAVEANIGYFEEHRVGIGDRVELTRGANE